MLYDSKQDGEGGGVSHPHHLCSDSVQIERVATSCDSRGVRAASSDVKNLTTNVDVFVKIRVQEGGGGGGRAKSGWSGA